MNKEAQLQRVLDCGIVAVVRSADSQQLVEVVRALVDGGVTVAEITMTVPGALEVMAQVRKALGDRVLLGAGTVLIPRPRAVLLAGAEYIVAPTVNLTSFAFAASTISFVMPAPSAHRDLTAWEAGADIVKVFPAEVWARPTGSARPFAADSPDADGRSRPQYRRRVLEGRGLLSGRRQPACRARCGGQSRFRPSARSRRPVQRHCETIPPKVRDACRSML